MIIFYRDSFSWFRNSIPCFNVKFTLS